MLEMDPSPSTLMGSQYSSAHTPFSYLNVPEVLLPLSPAILLLSGSFPISTWPGDPRQAPIVTLGRPSVLLNPMVSCSDCRWRQVHHPDNESSPNHHTIAYPDKGIVSRLAAVIDLWDAPFRLSSKRTTRSYGLIKPCIGRTYE